MAKKKSGWTLTEEQKRRHQEDLARYMTGENVRENAQSAASRLDEFTNKPYRIPNWSDRRIAMEDAESALRNYRTYMQLSGKPEDSTYNNLFQKYQDNYNYLESMMHGQNIADQNGMTSLGFQAAARGAGIGKNLQSPNPMRYNLDDNGNLTPVAARGLLVGAANRQASEGGKQAKQYAQGAEQAQRRLDEISDWVQRLERMPVTEDMRLQGGNLQLMDNAADALGLTYKNREDLERQVRRLQAQAQKELDTLQEQGQRATARQREGQAAAYNIQHPELTHDAAYYAAQRDETARRLHREGKLFTARGLHEWNQASNRYAGQLYEDEKQQAVTEIRQDPYLSQDYERAMEQSRKLRAVGDMQQILSDPEIQRDGVMTPQASAQIRQIARDYGLPEITVPDEELAQYLEALWQEAEAARDKGLAALTEAGYDGKMLQQYIDQALNEAEMDAFNAQAAEAAAAHPVGASVGSVGANLVGGVGYLSSIPRHLANSFAAATGNMGAYEPIDTNKPLYAPTQYARTVRQEVAQALLEKDPSGNKEWAYNLGMSLADNVAQMALAAATFGAGAGGQGANQAAAAAIQQSQAASLANMGLTAASQTMVDLTEKGIESNQAYTLATISGALEIATEKIGVDNLIGTLTRKQAASVAKQITTGMLKQGLAEGGEEVLSEVGNIVADTIIRMDESDMKTAIEQGQRQGMTREQAVHDYIWKQALPQIEEAGVAGFASGLVFGLGGAAVNVASGTTNATGERILSQPDGIYNIQARAEKYGIDAGSLTEDSTPHEVGTVAREVMRMEQADREKVEALAAKRNYSNNAKDAILSAYEGYQETGAPELTAEDFTAAFDTVFQTAKNDAKYDQVGAYLEKAMDDPLVDGLPWSTVAYAYQMGTRDYQSGIKGKAAAAGEKLRTAAESVKAARDAKQEAKPVKTAPGMIVVQSIGADDAVILKGGKELHVADMDTEGKPEQIVRLAMDLNLGKKATNEMLRSYKGDMTPQDYFDRYVEAYQIGADGGNLRSAKQAAAALGDQVAEQAYNRGRQTIGNIMASERMGRAGKVLLEDYNYEAPAQMEDYYRAGREGRAYKDLQTGQKVSPEEAAQLRAIYKAGQRDAAEAAKTPARQSPKIELQVSDEVRQQIETGTDKTAQDRRAAIQTAKVLTRISKNIDRVIFTDNAEVAEDGSVKLDKVAYWDPSTKTISVDINAGRGNTAQQTLLQRTLSHELTHYIKSISPAEYQALQDFALQELGKTQDVEQLIRAKIETYKAAGIELTREEAMEEITADACEMMLEQTDMLERLAKQNRTLWQRIKDFVRDMLNRIARLYKGLDPTTAEAAALQDSYDQLRKLWDKAFAASMTKGEVPVSQLKKHSVKTAGTMADARRQTPKKAKKQPEPETSPGTRYKVNPEAMSDAEKSTERKGMQKRIKTLETQNRRLREQLKRTPPHTPNAAGIKRAASTLKKEYQGNWETDEIAEELTGIWAELDKGNREKAYDKIHVLAMELAENYMETSPEMETYNEIKRLIRAQRLYLTPELRGDLDAIGGYDYIRKHYIGRLRLANSGTGVDQLYQELNSLYPYTFPEEVIVPSDQLMQIIDFLDNGKELFEQPADVALPDLTEWMESRVLETVSGVKKAAPTAVDKAIERARKAESWNQLQRAAREAGQEKILEAAEAHLQEQMEQRIAEEAGKARSAMQKAEAAAAEREEYNQRNLAELKRDYMQRLETEKQKAGAAEAHEQEQLERMEGYYKNLYYEKSRAWYQNTKERFYEKKEEAELRKRLLYHTHKLKQMAKNGKAGSPEMEQYIQTVLGDVNDLTLKASGVAAIADSIQGVSTEELEAVKYQDKDNPRRRITPEEAAKNPERAGKKVVDLEALRKWYDAAKADPDFIPDAHIERLLKRYDQKQIKDMELSEVRDLLDIALNIEHEITTKKQLIDAEEKRQTYTLARQIIRDVEESTGYKHPNLNKYTIEQGASPLKLIRRYTGYHDDDPLYQMALELRDAETRKTDYIMRAYRPFERFTKDKKFMEHLTGKDKVPIIIPGMDSTGKTYAIKITPDQRVALYLHSKNWQNLRHIEGGVTIPDYDAYVKGDMEKAWDKATKISLKPSEVKKITAGMTEKERAYANALERYYNTVSKAEINETSVKLKGYELAKVDNYYPIETNKDFVQKEFDSLKFDGTIEGMGFTKERQFSGLPLLLNGASRTFERSVNNHATYTKMAIPMRNLSKILGINVAKSAENRIEYKEDTTAQNAPEGFELQSLIGTIREKWGTQAVSNIEKMIADLSGVAAQKDDFSKAMSKLRSAYAGAVLELNPGTAMKQLIAYPTAASVLGWDAIAAGLKNWQKVDIDRVAAVTPLMWHRLQGYIDSDIGDWAKQHGKTPPKALNWNQGVDLAVVKQLWKASQWRALHDNPSLRDSPAALDKKTAEIWNEVMYDAQANYSIMGRGKIFRTTDPVARTLAMFKTEPFKQMEMLTDSLGNLRAKKRQLLQAEAYAKNHHGEQADQAVAEAKQKYKAAVKRMGQAVPAIAVSNLAEALINFGWMVMRGRKDDYENEEGKMTPWSAGSAIIYNWITNMTGIVPVLGVAAEAAAADLFDKSWFSLELAELSMINDLQTNIRKLIKTASSEESARDRVLSAAESLTSLLSLTGKPIRNIKKDVDALINMILRATMGREAGGYWARRLTQPSTMSGRRAQDMKALYTLGQADDAKSADRYNAILNDMLQSLTPEERADQEKAIAGQMRRRAQEDWEAGNITEQELRDLIAKIGVAGDQSADELANRYFTDFVRQQQEDGELTPEEALEELKRLTGETDEDKLYWDTQKWDYEAQTGESWHKYDQLTEAAYSDNGVEEAMQELTDHGVSRSSAESALRAQVGEWYSGTAEDGRTMDAAKAEAILSHWGGMSQEEIDKQLDKWDCKAETGIDYSDIRQQLLDGNITESQAAEMWMEYGNYNKEEADRKAGAAAFLRDNDELQDIYDDSTLETVAWKYESYGSGIPVETFADFIAWSKETTADLDANGETISGSRKDKLISYIAALPLPPQQKNNLMLADNSRYSLKNMPW